MQTVRGEHVTEDYIWRERDSDLLGEGAIGKVYRGISKLNPSIPVAIKTFKNGLQRTKEEETRELDILITLQHENIVRILGIQDELFPSTRGPKGITAIIMELGLGNLNTVLKQPENRNGLPESEFLVVWEHLTNAMIYLRQHGISHRDLKPGNILIFKGKNGTNVYKLTDFDRARYLEENESFPSLAGTPDYAHPEMCARKYLNHDSTCNYSVDLWSIGVTLFECAAGSLPFKIHWARDGKEVYDMLKHKPKGTIRASRDPNTRKISYSSKLPSSCLLSKGLQLLLCPIIGNLLEWDYEEKRSIWSYQDYFDATNDVLKRRKVHVFNLNTVSTMTVFLEPGGHTPQLLEDISFQSKIVETREDLVLSFHGVALAMDKCSPVPTTTLYNPLILSIKNPEVKRGFRYTSRDFSPFTNVQNGATDNETAQKNMEVSFVRGRELEQMDQSLTNVDSAVVSIHQMILNQLTEFSQKEENWIIQLSSIEQSLNLILSLKDLCEKLRVSKMNSGKKINEEFEDLMTTITSAAESYSENIQKLKAEIFVLRKSIERLLASRSGNQNILDEWLSLQKGVPNLHNVKTLMQYGLEKKLLIKRSYEILRFDCPRIATEYSCGPSIEKEDYQSRERDRAIERRLMMINCEAFTSIHNELRTIFDTAVEQLSFWYSSCALPSLQQITVIQTNLANLQDQLKSYANQIPDTVNSLIAEFRIQGDKLLRTELSSELRRASQEPSSSIRQKGSLTKLKASLEQGVKAHKEIMDYMEENGNLHDELEQILGSITIHLQKSRLDDF